MSNRFVKQMICMIAVPFFCSRILMLMFFPYGYDIEDKRIAQEWIRLGVPSEEFVVKDYSYESSYFGNDSFVVKYKFWLEEGAVQSYYEKKLAENGWQRTPDAKELVYVHADGLRLEFARQDGDVWQFIFMVDR